LGAADDAGDRGLEGTASGSTKGKGYRSSRSCQSWEKLGLCEWLIDGDPVVAALTRASEAGSQQYDQFDRLLPNRTNLLLRAGLEPALPLELPASRHGVRLKLCQVAGLTGKPSSIPVVVRAQPISGRWACRYLADDGKPDKAYVDKGEWIAGDDDEAIHSKRLQHRGKAFWPKAIYLGRIAEQATSVLTTASCLNSSRFPLANSKSGSSATGGLASQRRDVLGII
jgi:hypothetical protein